MISSQSEATTQKVLVQVVSRYVPEQSQPATGLYFFMYTITIRNQGSETVHLQSRHWVITDANHHIEEVRGAGVIGETPRLAPGESFTYSSGCMLRTPYGTMKGSYQMIDSVGDPFDVEIAPFLLSIPHAVN